MWLELKYCSAFTKRQGHTREIVGRAVVGGDVNGSACHSFVEWDDTTSNKDAEHPRQRFLY